MMKSLLLAACAAISLAGAADATTYVGNRTAGTATAALSITTDNTIGVLSTANITDWTISMTDGAVSFTLFGPQSGNNSGLLISGTALSATATSLLFDFSAASGFALFQAPDVGSGQTFYCTQISGCFDFSGPGEGIDANSNFAFQRNSLTGSQVIATAGNVPEPEAWALLIGGLGAVGAAARRRRVAAVTA